ncbi:MAG: hypothetical protein ACMUIG_08790 [Thermoplasmatota archaeon]
MRMPGFVIKESAVRAIVLSFSILGLGLLVLISLISDVEEVAIADLADHLGEEIECRGTVVGARHIDTGSANILVMQGNSTLEVYIERSDRMLRPGHTVRIRGEPFKVGDDIRITVQSDRSIRIVSSEDPPVLERDSEPNRIYSAQGTLITCRSWGENGFSGSLFVECVEERLLIDIDARDVDLIPRSGDLVNITGAKMENGGMILFGDSIEILSSPGVRAAYLMEIVRNLETDPGNIPLGQVTFQCYPRYEPSGRTLFIGEEPDGSRLSIRINTEHEVEGIHKGDLIEVVNATFSWNPESVRYEIETSVIRVLMPHGLWIINLASLEWGIGEYEGCRVRLEGSLTQVFDSYHLHKEGKSIEVRNVGEDILENEGWLEGIVIFDPDANVYYLDAAG